MENPDALTHSPPADAATLAEGLKDSLPIVISYIPVAFAFGLNATKLGFTPLESLFFSCIIYAGASQFVITAMLAVGRRAHRHGDGRSPRSLRPFPAQPHPARAEQEKNRGMGIRPDR